MKTKAKVINIHQKHLDKLRTDALQLLKERRELRARMHQDKLRMSTLNNLIKEATYMYKELGGN